MTCFAAITDAQSVVLATTLATIVGALSWLGKTIVSAVLWFYGRLSREAEMLVAIKAEIETGISSLAVYADPDVRARLRAELEGRPNYKIFAPLYRDYFIFDNVKPDITKLPEATIKTIVKFYDGIGGFDALLASMQEQRFESFPAKQRLTSIDFMSAAAAAIVTDGDQAVQEIDAERKRLKVKRVACLLAMYAALALGCIGAGLIGWAAADSCGFST